MPAKVAKSSTVAGAAQREQRVAAVAGGQPFVVHVSARCDDAIPRR